ncbi:hypothetical protein HMPREF9520_02460 [Enterococcus faecalis TX1467]|nr:hypothetical protein HMPREF9520_02460 [Enterococcus faecalis TX1467]
MEDLHGRKIIIEETERSIQTKLVYLPTMLERSPLTFNVSDAGKSYPKKKTDWRQMYTTVMHAFN